MKKKLLYTFCFLILAAIQVEAQNCSQNLEDAKRAYYNGQFSEVLPGIENCLDRFSREEQSEAYRLLVNNCLVLGQSEAADRHMSLLLESDPTYFPRENDLAEFNNLFNTYNIVPNYSFGFVGG